MASYFVESVLDAESICSGWNRQCRFIAGLPQSLPEQKSGVGAGIQPTLVHYQKSEQASYSLAVPVRVIAPWYLAI